MSSSASRRSDTDDGGVFGGLFDEASVRSPPSGRTDSSNGSKGAGGGNGGDGLRESDLQRLSQMILSDETSSSSAGPAKSVKTLDDDGSASAASVGTRKVVAFDDDDDDDATSVATSKVLVEGEVWISIEEGGASSKKGDPNAPPAVRSDYLSTWPADKVAALAQHLQAAPWHDVRYRLQTFQKGMTGEDIVAWLKSANFAKTDGEAQDIAAAMITRRMFFQLNRRSKFRGFAATKKQQYTLQDNFTEENASLSSKISRAVKSANESAASTPFKLIVGNHMVTVVIEERQRRPDPTLPYSSEFLRPQLDGPAWSMDKLLVPVPPVDDESPDMCEWMLDDWEVVVNDATDENGWRYSLDFKDPLRFVKSEPRNKNFLVRLREWSRPARKRIEKKNERAAVEAEQKKAAAAEEGPTEAEIEEERKKDLLSKAATSVARLPRSGTLELHVTHGKDLLVVKDSFVTVEHGKGPNAFRDRSDTCPRSKRHHWQYKVDIPIQSDLDGATICVFQEGSLGRSKCLGTTRLDIDANELSRDGTLVLKPVDAKDGGDEDDGDGSGEGGRRRGSATDDVGEIFVHWVFNPTGTGTHKSSAIQRCILTVTLEKATGLTREKKRIGPCGVPIPGKGKEKLHVFFKAKYFGEFCEMQCQSPPIKFCADLDVGWTFSALAIPSVPVVVECWHSDEATPVGNFFLEFCEGEQTVEMELKRCGVEGLPSQHTSAGGNLGKVQLKMHWLPEEDPMNLAALGVDMSWCDRQRNLVGIWA